jgi:hypothetical protein
MNTLLIDKGFYTQQEFQQFFVEWAIKERTKSTSLLSHAYEVSA